MMQIEPVRGEVGLAIHTKGSCDTTYGEEMDSSHMPVAHPATEPLDFLVGTWVGEGSGNYPTIEPFTYREEAVFSHTGRPFLAYSQRTWLLSDGRALHSECGYWRTGPMGHVELVVAHPTGVVEIEEGTVEGTSMTLASRAVHNTSTAKEVSVLARSFEVDRDLMTYRLTMGAVGQAPQRHLTARLERARP